MKAALLNDSNHFVVCQTNKPVPQEKEVLIKVKAASICDSDIKQLKQARSRPASPIIGHEFAGIVADIGSQVSQVKIGDRVAGIPFLPCGSCADCQADNQHWCEHSRKIGTHQNGCFAEYVVLPEENVIGLGDKISFEEAALLEPLAKAAHGVKLLEVQAGDTVAVFGLNTFGLMNIQWLRQTGAKRIIGLDTDGNNLWEAKVHGVTNTINLLRESIDKRIAQLTNGQGVDIALECTGSSLAEEQCLLITKKGGTIGYYGMAPSNMMLRQQAFENIFRREYTIKGLWNTYSAPFPGEEWTASLALIEQKKLAPQQFISHRFSLEDIQQAFDLAMDENISNQRVIVVPKG
ncbi:galactitol-1-phosphate 5-dehydrogenase [Enterococcus sp. 669A]|uniref:Galactitol-1-phosphate 5-dehydrogenase n=1 Tax=Candidatus Enterococcus moelleringii TaxID=2815325 RepID=A0ABS3LDN8_9ENTE|nr:galactitol-1-phosphate 5-dehydrogenase [Enterococcus sp. 669A]MBO1307735.1 galactitol-1-phosphate 5-dehydrogenase [Enterococcus sp. 669A]